MPRAAEYWRAGRLWLNWLQPGEPRTLFSRLRSVAGWLVIALIVIQISIWVARVISRGDSVTMKMTLLGLAGVSGLMMLLIMVPNPVLGPYLVFGAMPITGWLYKQSPGSGFNFLLDGLLVVSFISVVLNRKESRLPQVFALPVIFLLLLGFVQTANPAGGGTEVTAAYAIRENVLPMLALFLGAFSFKTMKQAERFMGFLMLVATFNGLWAAKQILIGLDSGEEVWAGLDKSSTFFVDGQLRAFSTFDAPWAYAFYTNLIFAIGICVFMGSRSWTMRLVSALAMMFTVVGMYLAIVRTTWIMAALTPPFIALIRFRHPLRPAVALAALGGALLMVTLMMAYALPTGRPNPVGIAQTLASFNILDDESMQIRFRNWAIDSLPALLDHPFGKGLGTTGGVGKKFNPSGFITTDNTYFTMGIEFSWAGLVLYVFLLLASLSAGLRWQVRARAPFASWLLAGFVTALVLTILSGFLNVYSTGSNGVYLFFLIGLMGFVAERASARSPSSAQSLPAPTDTASGFRLRPAT